MVHVNHNILTDCLECQVTVGLKTYFSWKDDERFNHSFHQTFGTFLVRGFLRATQRNHGRAVYQQVENSEMISSPSANRKPSGLLWSPSSTKKWKEHLIEISFSADSMCSRCEFIVRKALLDNLH